MTQQSQGQCCINGKRVRPVTVVPSLDGEGQFGEGCWEPVVRVEIEGQFVVAAAQVLHKRMSSTDHSD